MNDFPSYPSSPVETHELFVNSQPVKVLFFTTDSVPPLIGVIPSHNMEVAGFSVKEILAELSGELKLVSPSSQPTPASSWAYTPPAGYVPVNTRSNPSAAVTARLRAVSFGILALTLAVVTGLAGYYYAYNNIPRSSGDVTVVDGAKENLGFAEQVYDVSNIAVAQIVVESGGTGTGFFYTRDRIATNAHVVLSSPQVVEAINSGATAKVDVLLRDGRTRQATILGVDEKLDLAVLSVEPIEGVEPLAFRDVTADMKPGSPVAVVGYPFGGSQVVSTGVLSAVVSNSQFSESSAQSILLQTDAAVNPGNSGGPLMDASGAVAGIVTLRPDEVAGRAVSGLALAVPAEQVRASLQQLEEGKRVEYAVMGVDLRTATDDDSVKSGAVVLDVTAGSGADKAGVVKDDVIVSVDGKDTATSQAVIYALLGKTPGDTVELGVNRAGKTSNVEVTLQPREDS